jgi:methyl-accepting chemotaxis protein
VVGANWTVPFKLYLLIGLSAISALVIALVAISTSRDLASLGHEVFDVGLDRSLKASQIALEFERQAGLLNLVTYQLDIAAAETKKVEFINRSREIREQLDKLFAVVMGTDAEYGRQIFPALASLDQDAQTLFSLVEQLQTNEAAEVLAGKLTPRITHINGMLFEFKERMFAAADDGVANMDRSARQVSYLLFVIFLALLVATLLVGGYIARTITRPLAALTSTIQQVAGGRLDVTVDGTERRDEVGSLARATQVFLDNARKTNALVSSVAQNATQVAQSVEHATLAIAHVSEGAAAQLDTVREVSQALNLSTSAITGVSESTQAAGLNVRSVRDKTVEGMERMREMVRDVEEIAVSTRRIASITQSIARIATQTNMLSLNAAIEAARAGEHGRGFAVVAEEVRKLAESSGQMAREISELIRSATEQAANGVEKAQLVNGEIEGISREISQSDQLVNSIAVAMEQQRTMMDTLDQRMKDLTRIGQSNASASEEITATMVDLAKLAEHSRLQAQQFG